MKSALIYAEDEQTLRDRLLKFLLDKNYLDYKILALLTDEPSEEIFLVPEFDAVKKLRPNFPATLEVTTPRSVNKFVYEFVDALFVLNPKNFDELTSKFVNLGLKPRKIISIPDDNSIAIIQFSEGDTRVICFEGLEFHIKNQADMALAYQTLAGLKWQKKLYNLPREYYSSVLKEMYRERMGRELDLDNPKTYTEKINWLKLYDSTPLKGRLSDKFAVREWVTNKIGEGHLAPLIGAWDSFDEINFDELPDRFVLKCNHASGFNYFVPDKNKLDVREARERINSWLAVDYGMKKFELHYSSIKRKIIAEPYMEERTGGLHDYRFYCFNGEPIFVCVTKIWNYERHKFHQGYYDMNWEDIGAMFEDAPSFDNPLPKPKNLANMIEYSKILSEAFACVRVDFYNIDDKILFGEMTFIPNAGFLPYKGTWTYERDLEIGNMIKL